MHPNLQRLQLIRAIVAVLQLSALGYARWVLALELDYGLILLILIVLALVNGALWLRLRRASSPSTQEFLLHLWVDIAGLGVLLYFTGGATNPFVSYLLVPVTIAAASLPWRPAIATAAVALGCYSLLLFWYLPLPVLMPMDMPDGEHTAHTMANGSNSLPNLHILGMWFSFAVSSALIIYFVVKLATEVRQRETRLRQYREETLRNEQIVAVATQAAGTAHALGTPLGTMAVLLKDLMNDHAQDPVLHRDLSTLQQQVALCRTALRDLSRKADFKQQHREQVDLRAFLQGLLQKWQLLRPETPCRFSLPESTSPTLLVDPTLEQALINLLNNAADASPAGISVDADWTDQRWQLQVRDQGPGIARELQEQLGTAIVSNKPGGMGVGLVLSQATLNRLGGSVSLYPQQPRGTLTVIELPLESVNA